ncbi:MAG TPA: C25 family cysteine peptidase, partial [Chryseolinea sp.]
MRSFFLLPFCLFACLKSYAQVGNEWIDFDRTYYKISTAKESIYKVSYTDLQAVGFPVNGIDPTRIQLFHRGVEQAIFVSGENDLQFDPADFIEFFGQKNDGTLDGALYRPASSQPHKYYNLYSDTTSYFLTVGPAPGKRIATFNETNNGGLSAEPYHIAEKMLLLTNEFAAGTDIANEIFNTAYDLGEGWTSGKIFQTQSVDYTFPDVVNRATSWGPPQLELLLVGRGSMAHQVEIYAGPSYRLLTALNFSGYEPQKVVLPLQWSDVAADNKVTVRVKVNGVGGQPDRISVSYLKLTYPELLDAAGTNDKTFRLIANANDKSFVQIANTLPGTRLFDITEAGTVRQIATTSTTTLDAIVPATSSARKIFAATTVISPAIKAVNFRRITPSQHDFIIIGHPLLRKPALGYSDPVKAYAEYRASAQGGGYDTLLVNIQQLYDQFSYGETTSLAIYNFLEFLSNTGAPKYLLLIGKGLDVWYKYYRNPSGFPVFKDLIPPPGYPGADMAYSAGLSGTQFEPAIPTGRIPAMKADEVASYLNKVKESEALPFDDLWRKNVLHLSGGRELGEPELLQSYLLDLQRVAEDFHYGAKVSALAKYSKEIQLINVSKQVNNGVNLITFFGHSSATNLDFDIGYVSDPVMGYNNKGKYPTLLMNGCNVGSYFLTYSTFGEDWVLARDKGAAAFIAHSSYGFTHLLKRYSDYFYEVGYSDSTFIYKGIGDIQKEVARRYMQTAAPVMENISQVQQMVLLGDPAVKLFGAPKADLEINNDNVSIESLNGQPILALTDSFALKLVVRNFGQAKPDTIRIEVTRGLGDNSTIIYDSLYPVTKYSDTLRFIIRKGREEAFGNNTFKVTIDPDDLLDELTKENNSATREFVIPLNGTKNLYPLNYAIVNTPEVLVSFQTTDLVSGERDFLLELDTVNTFDSPFRKQFVVKGKVLAKRAVSLLTTDTLAYYWRTKLANPTSVESAEWTESSFTYIADGPEGWAQVHFSQYLKNETLGLIKDEGSRRFNFKETVTDVDIKTYGGNHPSLNTDVNIKINNEEFNLTRQGFICRDNSINLIAFDKYSATPYIGVPFKWYNRANRACGREPWVINNYVPGDMVTGDGFDIVQFVNNVQEGDSVVLFNIGDPQYGSWPDAAKSKLGELGISVAQIDGLAPGEPIVIFAKKGLAPGAATIIKAAGAPADTQELIVNKSITGRFSAGSLATGLIGPAMTWQSMTAKYTELDASDVVSFDIIGVKLNGTAELLFADASNDQDLSTVDASQFPYLKVVFKAADELNLTAAQLSNWIVIYTPAPDGLLIFRGPTAQQQNLNEGEKWNGSYGFINITDQVFSDSLTVHAEVYNQSTRSAELDYFKIKAPLPGDTATFDLEVSTINKVGLNDINVHVNPKIIPEQYYDNNVLQLRDYLLVEEETIRPVLDVSIDGRYIQNRDFVSSNPLILIKVWD